MDMTLDGWVFIGVARQCLSKQKGYPDNVVSNDDVSLNAAYKKRLPKWINASQLRTDWHFFL